MLSKFIAILVTLILLVACQIAVMIYGWGIQPKSWWWIIGVGFFVQLALSLIAERLKKE